MKRHGFFASINEQEFRKKLTPHSQPFLDLDVRSNKSGVLIISLQPLSIFIIFS